MTAAWAQTASQPLNLKLPANSTYAGRPALAPRSRRKTSSTQPNPSASMVTINGARPSDSKSPGVYYGDTSGARA
jgi:hypothetical protein